MSSKTDEDFTIEHLPDSLTLHIFSFLDVKSLCLACRVNRHFRKLANDRMLWNHTDLSETPLSLQAHWKILRAHLPSSLTFLRIRGFLKKYQGTPKWKTESISSPFLMKLHQNSPHLQVLILEEMFLSYRLHINDFPCSLTHLVLRECEFSSHIGFFDTMSNVLPNLKELDISMCTGFPGVILYQLAKWKTMQTLRLEGCFRVKDDNIHLLCGEVIHLKELDLRGTGISDAALHVIGTHQKDLEKLWVGSGDFDCPVTDQGVYGLYGLRKTLEVLDISGSDITDVGFEYALQTYPKLKLLDITKCKLTRAIVDKWRENAPNCIIIF